MLALSGCSSWHAPIRPNRVRHPQRLRKPIGVEQRDIKTHRSRGYEVCHELADDGHELEAMARARRTDDDAFLATRVANDEVLVWRRGCLLYTSVKADGATNMEMVRFGGQLVYRDRKRVLRAGKVTGQEEWSVGVSQ